jgi:hypothetical protein
MVTKREFIDGVRKGWETAGYARFTTLNMRDGTRCCCAQGAFLLSRNVPVRRVSGDLMFDPDVAEPLLEQIPKKIRWEIERINDTEAAQAVNPKEYVLRNLETIEWENFKHWMDR